MENLNQVRELFNFNVLDLIDQVMEESNVQGKIIELNQEQLQDGTDALGQTIVTIGGSPYRAYTVLIKKAKGQPTNKVTLYDTGDFYETFKVVILKSGYKITANFKKDDSSILDNFSSQYDFLGLDDERLAEFAIKIILPRLEVLIKKRFGF